MAEGLGQARETIKNELTCPLCLDIFQEPKRLPCDHIYCKEPCLKGLMLRSHDATITCPECRTVVQVPQRDVNNLPTAFRINRMKEVFETMQREETDSSDSISTCQTHPSQELVLFCETCNEILCRDCMLMSSIHTNHQYGYIDKLAENHRQTINDLLKPKQEQEKMLQSTLQETMQVRLKIQAESEKQKNELHRHFDSLVKVIQDERNALVGKLEEITMVKVAEIKTREEEISTTLQKLSSTICSIENSCQNLSDSQLLIQMQDEVSQLDELSSKVQTLSLLKDETLGIGVEVVSPEVLQTSCLRENLVYTLVDPSLCKLLDAQESLTTAVTGHTTKFTLQLVDSNHCPCTGKQNILITLHSIRTGSVTTGTSTPVSPGCYKVTYTPTTRGRHTLSIKVNNVHIAGSPINVFTRKLPAQIKDPVSVISNLSRPGGLTQFNDVVLAVEHNQNRVLAIDTTFDLVATYGEHYLNGPSEVTTDSESNIYVCTIFDSQVQKISMSGTYIKSIGGKGKKPSQFNFPNGNCITNKNELYVCDSENHRIQVFDTDLNLKQTFGTQGSRKGQFEFPADVTHDSKGNIYIVDKNNHQVQVFTPEGKFIQMFGKKGRTPGELHLPISIHIDDNLLYLTEYGNNRVSVFTTAGDFVTTFGEEYLSGPEGITMDKDGFLYATSHFSQIFVF